jgi:oxygen-independent coproporphyrinogen-3 oxidase
MVGLGCGARSYTRAYHYSNEYAVGASGVRAILQAYINTPAKGFAYASYGFHLNEDEQHRRYVLKSLLEAGGLDLLAYRERFGSTPLTDLPELSELQKLRLVHTIGWEQATGKGQAPPLRMVLTAAGLERSDAIGPWLYSEHVQQLMEDYQLR